MIKKIFIYWGQKFNNAPKVVTKCLLSWKIRNPTWEIIEIDDGNLNEYINLEEIINIKNKKITNSAYSDIIRIFLLDKFGGCWCDATTFCNQPLDSWLYENIQTGFFAFDKPGEDRLLSSWFLYSEKNNYIISKWKEATINYWNNHNEIHTYFWFHYLFGDLYKNDKEIQKLWYLTSKISADYPHFLQNNNLLDIPSDTVITHINKKSLLYKLTYKLDMNEYNDKCILEYLYNTIQLRFIHIGKCGGTTIVKNFDLINYHLNKNYSNDENYIIWIRHPLKRFVSAFNFSYSVINIETCKLDINNLSLENCLAPGKICNKMTNNYAFSTRYDYLINYFQNPNNLAESLTSEDIKIRKLAFELMNSEEEHIYKGIGWYLNDGRFIEENYNRITFIGSIENMENDMLKLSNMLNIKITKKKVRENTYNKNTVLSEKAIKNLLDFYKETDYKALQKLVDFNLIPKELFDLYLTYN
jgi:hypothetical protein